MISACFSACVFVFCFLVLFCFSILNFVSLSYLHWPLFCTPLGGSWDLDILYSDLYGGAVPQHPHPVPVRGHQRQPQGLQKASTPTILRTYFIKNLHIMEKIIEKYFHPKIEVTDNFGESLSAVESHSWVSF